MWIGDVSPTLMSELHQFGPPRPMLDWIVPTLMFIMFISESIFQILHVVHVVDHSFIYYPHCDVHSHS